MRITKTYAIYILRGLLYPIVKLIWYIKGLVYLRGVIYGLIAGVLTICIGILALNEYDGADKPVGHWLAALIPLIIIPLTPIIMIYHLGFRMFLAERLTIFMILEALVLLYDVFQMISKKEKLLEELHRVLKPGGILFATAEHLDVNEFMNIFAKSNLFTLVEQRGEVFRFERD